MYQPYKTIILTTLLAFWASFSALYAYADGKAEQVLDWSEACYQGFLNPELDLDEEAIEPDQATEELDQDLDLGDDLYPCYPTRIPRAPDDSADESGFGNGGSN